MTIRAGSIVKSEENDYTTYTVLKLYVNKKDNQNYLNIQADKYPQTIYVKQHISLFTEVKR